MTSCSKCVGRDSSCLKCGGYRIKHGRTSAGKQRYLCKTCNESKVNNPQVIGFGKKHDDFVVNLLNEGGGIRSIGRLVSISASSVIRIVLRIASTVEKPKIEYINKIQVDEICSFVHSKLKQIWIIYSWDQREKKVLSLAVGTRSKSNLRLVVNPLLEAGIESINTDYYSGYKGVIPKKIHITFKRRNNGIERHNLTIRTDVKRLNRRTICFSKSKEMLEAVLKIYFWH
jgi:insertion element IS1 protein InsB